MERVTLHAEGTPLCSFKSAASVPIRSLKAHFSPIQTGSGDPSPSNVRPIAGRTGLTITQCGKNLFNKNAVSGYRRINGSGEITAQAGASISDYIPVEAGLQYTLTHNHSISGNYRHAYYSKDKTYMGVFAGTNKVSTLTIPANVYFVRLTLYDDGLDETQFEKGSAATAYEPYAETVTTVTFPSNGKNRVDRSTGWTNGCYEENTGRILTSGSGYRDNKYIAVIPGENYTMSWSVYGFDMRVVFYNADKRVTRTANYSTRTGSTFAIADDEYYIRICQTTNTNYGIPEGLQIEHGSTATTYEAYSSDNTFYGGYVDPAKGVIVEEYKKVFIPANDIRGGTGSFIDNPNYQGSTWTHRYFMISESSSGGSSLLLGNCMVKGNTSNSSWKISYDGTGLIHYSLANDAIGVTAETSAGDRNTAVASWLTENQPYIVYKLGSPKEYPLDSVSLLSFEGQNYIWSSADEKVETDYDLFETKMIQDAKKRSLAYNQPHLESKTGSIVSFTPHVRASIKELKCEFTPIQDLHGYDHPWLAGGGKNIMPPAVAGSETVNGITFTSDGNGKYTITGTATAYAEKSFNLTTGFTIPSSDVTGVAFMNDEAHSGMVFFYFMNGATIVDNWSMNAINRYAGSYGTMANKYCDSIKLRVDSGETVNMTLSPMLVVKPNDYSTFAPYENICPITGWTNSSLYHLNGINYIPSNVEYLPNKVRPSNGVLIGSVYSCICVPVPAGSIYMRKENTGAAYMCFIDSPTPVAGDECYEAKVITNHYGYTFDNSAGHKYALICGPTDNTDVSTFLSDSKLSLTTDIITSYPGLSFSTKYPVTFPATKNLFNQNATSTGNGFIEGKYLSSGGAEQTPGSGIAWNVSEYIPIMPSTQYTISGLSTSSSTNPSVCWYSSTKTYIDGMKYNNNASITFTTPSNASYVRISYEVLKAGGIQLEAGSVATVYEPYGTIYGGYVDLISGKVWKIYHHMVVDKNTRVGIFPWQGVMTDNETGVEYTGILWRRESTDPKAQSYVSSICYCDAYPYHMLGTSVKKINTAGMYDGDSYGPSLYLPISLVGTTSESLSEFMANKVFHYVYKIREPILLGTLTSSQLKSLKSQNNIFSDLNGNTTVKYWTH